MTYVTDENVLDLEELPGMVHPEMAEPDWFSTWNSQQEKMRPQITYVLRTKGLGESVSCLRVFFRMIASPERRLRVAGIGGLWTMESMRGQGYATVLLEKLMEKFREEQHSVDLVVLHAPEARGLYSHLGFIEIEKGMFATTLHKFEDLIHIDHPYHWKLLPDGSF